MLFHTLSRTHKKGEPHGEIWKARPNDPPDNIFVIYDKKEIFLHRTQPWCQRAASREQFGNVAWSIRGNCNFHHVPLIVLHKHHMDRIFAVSTSWWSNLLHFRPLVLLINYLAMFIVKLIDGPTRQCFIRRKKMYNNKNHKIIIHPKLWFLWMHTRMSFANFIWILMVIQNH
jgi:hypothetical protein